jgi:hypothetical protein
MRIAVTSQDFRTVTGHAGRARHFLVYETDAEGIPVPAGRVTLTAEQSVHESGMRGAHPLRGFDVVLSAGFNHHFAQVMAQRGIEAAITDIEDPLVAVRDFLVRHATGTKLPILGCGSCDGGCEGDDHHAHAAPAA